MRRLWSGAACALIVLALLELRQSPATAQGGGKPASASTVYLVRHAEKADDGTEDPPLRAEGIARANTLAAMLADKGIVSIVTSPAKRTVQTAAPLAKTLGKQATVTKTSSADGVVSKIRAAKGNVLVVHHSNTVPEAIAKLGGPQMPTICEAVYDRLFVLQLAGQQPQFHETQYGTPTPPIGCQ
jgi:phosphohistidine phosphatase SixA